MNCYNLQVHVEFGDELMLSLQSYASDKKPKQYPENCLFCEMKKKFSLPSTDIEEPPLQRIAVPFLTLKSFQS